MCGKTSEFNTARCRQTTVSEKITLKVAEGIRATNMSNKALKGNHQFMQASQINSARFESYMALDSDHIIDTMDLPYHLCDKK